MYPAHLTSLGHLRAHRVVQVSTQLVAVDHQGVVRQTSLSRIWYGASAVVPIDAALSQARRTMMAPEMNSADLHRRARIFRIESCNSRHLVS